MPPTNCKSLKIDLFGLLGSYFPFSLASSRMRNFFSVEETVLESLWFISPIESSKGLRSKVKV